jgi:hypothetical protein
VIFLVEYDRGRGLLLRFKSFEDSQKHEAEDERLNLELKGNQQGPEHEIVLLEAVNEAAVRRTHRRYFERIEELASIPGMNGND